MPLAHDAHGAVHSVPSSRVNDGAQHARQATDSRAVHPKNRTSPAPSRRKTAAFSNPTLTSAVPAGNADDWAPARSYNQKRADPCQSHQPDPPPRDRAGPQRAWVTTLAAISATARVRHNLLLTGCRQPGPRISGGRHTPGPAPLARGGMGGGAEGRVTPPCGAQAGTAAACSVKRPPEPLAPRAPSPSACRSAP